MQKLWDTGLKTDLNKSDTWFVINNVNFSNNKNKILHCGQKNQMFEYKPGNNCPERNTAVNNLECILFCHCKTITTQDKASLIPRCITRSICIEDPESNYSNLNNWGKTVTRSRVIFKVGDYTSGTMHTD